MVPIEDVLLWSLAQNGDRYIFGAEVPLSASDSDRWDCSELVEWSCGKAGVTPRVPDGAFYQWKHCDVVPVSMGLRTRGALLFVGDGVGVGRDAITHVAWSLGDGTTIEARGSKWGVGSWPSASRFDFAGLVPGVDYSPPLPEEDDDMSEALDKLNAIELRIIALEKTVDGIADRQVPEATVRADIVLNRKIAVKVGVPDDQIPK